MGGVPPPVCKLKENTTGPVGRGRESVVMDAFLILLLIAVVLWATGHLVLH
jgi:hypothetical protein